MLPVWFTMVSKNQAEERFLLSQEPARLLTVLASLLPLPQGRDKYCILAEWLRQGESEGLITAREVSALRQFLAEWWM